MTPAEKIRIGKAIADNIAERYKKNPRIPQSLTLYEELMSSDDGLRGFLYENNPLYKRIDKLDVLEIFVEKNLINRDEMKEYLGKYTECNENRIELITVRDIFFSSYGAEELKPTEKEIDDYVDNFLKKIADSIWRENDDQKQLNLFFLKEGEKLNKLREKECILQKELDILELKMLRKIQKAWKSGLLKHALLNHTAIKTKKKTTLARSVPLNQLYPEQINKQLSEYEEAKYEAKDIYGLDKITSKQFQALFYLVSKAQNQTEDEEYILRAWKELVGNEYKGFRIVAFKTSEYITQTQGKDNSIVSSKEKEACINALKEVEDIVFTVRWEEKDGKDSKHILAQHELIKSINPKTPWAIVEEHKDYKEIKKFQFFGIPERLFEYKGIPEKDKRYKGAKVLFDVINVNPDFFKTLKYADPEMKHISEALMRLSLIFLVEGSFRRKHFAIDEKKLLKRIGLIGENSRNLGRASKTLDKYITKLINHKTLEEAEKKGEQRIFKLPEKDQKAEPK